MGTLSISPKFHTQESRLRRHMRRAELDPVTVEEYATYALMRELGDSMDFLQSLGIMGWNDATIEAVEEFYQQERTEP